MIQGILLNAGLKNYENYKFIHIIVVSVIIFPLCLLKTVNFLRSVTMFSIVSLLFTLLLLIYELPLFMTRDVPRGKLELFNVDWSIFNAFGITFFAYNCQSGFYVAIERLTKRDIGHKKTVI